MLLKRLYLQGFKTFANKTEFIFDEGITAIVGPNGSGKSNVADAVRWVLGEQSFSELRGKRTVDMIFTGSRSRSRAGMAIATLTLDNSDGWLPIDYSEVEISRKAYRSGDNEYHLNGSRVRLRDIRDLLATSGLAQRTYTMIGQGLVDRALSLRADERRALFEEAAGISHYKSRRAETLRRLQETQRNIERVNDVLAEIEPRLRSLKRQANRARNYEQVSADLRHLLRIWYGYHWEASKNELRASRLDADHTEVAWKESRRKLIFVQEQIDDERRRLHRLQERINQRESERDGLREQLEHARRQVAILNERQQLVTRQLGEIEQEMPDLEANKATAQAELNEATSALMQVQATLADEQAVLVKFEATYQAQQTEISRWQASVRNLEQAQQAAQRQMMQAEGQLSQLRERLSERQAATVDPDEIAGLEARLGEISAEIKTNTTERDTHRTQRQQLQDKRQTLIRELKQLRRDHHNQTKTVNQVSKAVARLEERASLLDQMRRTGKKIKGKATIIGRFANYLTIPNNYQPAIEAALSAQLGTLLVPDRANLWQLFEQNLKASLLAAAVDGIAVNGHHPLPTHADVIGWAHEVVTFEDSAESLVRLLLGSVLLVKSAEAGYELMPQLPHGTLAVSPNGTLFHAGGLVERRNFSDSVLAQEKAWREAQDAVEKKREGLVSAESATNKLQTRIDTQQTASDRLLNDIEDIERQEQRLTHRNNQLTREQDRAQQQLRFLQRQQNSYEKDITRFSERIATLEQDVSDRQQQSARFESNLVGARAKLSALPIAEAQQQRAQQQQKIATTQTIVDGRRAVVDSRRSTLSQVESRLLRQQQRLQSLHNQQREINLEAANQRLHESQRRMQFLDEEIEPLRRRRTEVQTKVAELESEAAIQQKEAHLLESEYTEVRLALNKQENRIENLRERIHTDLGVVDLSYDEDETVQTPLPMTEVVEKLPLVDVLPTGIDVSIQKRRGQLQRMGAINPDAPAEYAETSKRFDFLSQQIEDLNKTEGQLRKVITELDELTSQEFAKTVEHVNGIFGDMFTRLFGGGSAELQLTNPDDLTITGVDILARLPRRRTQGLGLLSGGERSLTAAALIFSLLKVTPPPFSVMDEVDAALDEANINRFRDVLRELSLNTQFIVITHNRGTVQAANTIYGISMGGDGASQVISLKPEEYMESEFAG